MISDDTEEIRMGAITVYRKDLPLSCPSVHMQNWNMHPRVYLPIEETGTYMCPYCSTYYRLLDR